MSDGSVNIGTAWGYSHTELRRTMLVKPGWLSELRAERQRLFGSMSNAEVAAKLKERVTGTYYSSDTYADRAWAWNDRVDSICGYMLGFAQDAPRTARERRKAGYTEKLTPEAWMKVRGELERIPVPSEAWTNGIWRDRVEKLMEFLSGAARRQPESVVAQNTPVTATCAARSS